MAPHGLPRYEKAFGDEDAANSDEAHGTWRSSASQVAAQRAKQWSWAAVAVVLLGGTALVVSNTSVASSRKGRVDNQYVGVFEDPMQAHPSKATMAAQARPDHAKGMEVAHNPVFHKEVETKLRINFEARPDEAQQAALKSALLADMGVDEADVVGWTFEERIKGQPVGSKKEVAKKEAVMKRARALEGDDDEIDIEALFKALDTSGDGTLTRDEVVDGCDLVGMNEDEANALFDTLDEDGSGEISWGEMERGAAHIGKAGVNYEITLLVKMPDKDSAEQLKQNTAGLFTDISASCANFGAITGLKTKGCKAVVQRIVDDDWDDDWL